MLNTTLCQTMNSYQNTMALGRCNPTQGFASNPMMMMAMTMMSAMVMSMVSEAMGQGMMQMGHPGFGGMPFGQNSPLGSFLGNNCDNGAHQGGQNEYRRGLIFDPNPNDHNTSGNAPSNSATGRTQGVGQNLPEGVNGISYAKACQMVKDAGGQLNPEGKPTVLAIRSKNTTARNYEDAFVVLKPDGTMEKFSANTRPSKAGQDKAMLKPGEYQITPRWKDGKFHNDGFIVGSTRKNMNVGVARDRNGDGQYSDNELNGNASSSTIRLHRGNNNGTTSSAGCLNVKDYDSFLGSVGGSQASFNLVLVTM